MSFTPLLHSPSLPPSLPPCLLRLSHPSATILSYTLAEIVRRCRTNPFSGSPRVLASHRLSLAHPTPVSLRSIYYTSFSLPFPVRWFVFLVYPSPHDQIKRRRSRKSRWWKDLGLVCHHRLTADEGEWELGWDEVERAGFIGLVSKKNQDSLLLATRPVLYEKAN